MFMTGFASHAYALLRIVTGFLFTCHGGQKLFDFPVAMPVELNALIFVAGVIELVGGLLVMIGLFTHWVAFLCSGLMAAAYWIGHGTKALYPIENGGELAALYCFLFLYVAARGAGPLSIDTLRRGRLR